jgi:NADH:ubiquinone oxidoreductase subunit 3 (subunit A)
MLCHMLILQYYHVAMLLLIYDLHAYSLLHL